MPERLSPKERIRNLYIETCFLHLEGGRVDQAIGVILREAGKIKKPGQFHLGEGQWVNGINLETLRFSAGRTRTAMMVTMGVFDFTNGEFRFCESLKTVTGSVGGIRVTGFELVGQIDQGHRIFFAEGAREQQQKLLSETLAAIFRIREAEARMPKI